MPSFNLVTEKWIPCLTADGAAEFSLRETFTQAHDIKEISDDSPLVTIALHRLLLAILHRNFGPADFDEWKELWRAGKWDAAKLNDYFAQWQSRFELFDEERPFYQVPRMQAEKKIPAKKNQPAATVTENIELHPVALLAHEAATGNNGTLFDHHFRDSGQTYSTAQAARYLIARQAFSIGGGVSEPFNLSHAPLVGGYTVLVLGQNLFETLALNLLPYTEEHPIPHAKENGQSKDCPLWEQVTPQSPDKNGSRPLGYLDYLTWQSRRLHLIASEAVVTNCQHQQNLKLNNDGLFDPFQCYVKSRDKGFTARRLSESKALWRDSHALFEDAASAGEVKRPEIFNHLARVERARRRNEIAAQPAYRFAVTGMVNDQASVSLWSREILPLPLRYLTEKSLTAALKQAIQLTEDSETPLKEALKTLSITLVGKVDAPKLAESFQAKEHYWSSLNAPFKQLLEDLAADVQEDEDGEVRFGEVELPKWAKFVVEQADEALQHAINSLRGTARELKAASLAQAEFNKQMGLVKKNFPNLFPKGEKQ
jgi:CRISPR system Cascade subunit CasA